MEKMNIENF